MPAWRTTDKACTLLATAQSGTQTITSMSTITVTPALNIAIDYVAEKKVTSGLTGKQHAGILVRAVEEVTGVEFTPDDRLKLFAAFVELENGSALRQKLEKLGKLTVVEKATAVDAQAFL